MIILNTGDNNNKVIMEETPAERMQEIENKLFQLQHPVNASPDPPVMRLHPASFYKQFTFSEILNFAWKHGIYQFPTTELIDWLKSQINPQTTIEIAAGGGHISKHLPGVIATDSYLQDEPWVKDFYEKSGQHTIKYPSWVKKMDAITAIREHRPSTVIGCWTVERSTSASGEGIDELKVFQMVDKYIIVGNDALHKVKPVLKIAKMYNCLHVYKPDWLISKSSTPQENCIYLIDKLG